MCNITDKLQFILFADDTTVFMSHSDPQVLQNVFHQEIVKLFNWFLNNKLIVNYDKTKLMVFTNRNIDFNNVNKRVNEFSFECVNSLKFLGVIINHKLKWNEHINAVCNKLAKNIGILYKVQFYPLDILKMLYHTLITPYLNYCSTVWANFNKSDMERLLKLQKKAVRIITHSQYHAHSAPLFYELHILNVNDMGKFYIAVLMFLCHKRLLPSFLLTCFDLNQDVHNYNTRNASNYHLPKIRTTCMKNSFFFQGPVIWNSIPPEIKSSNTLNLFKTKFKQFLLNNYNNH